jgi:hypothetical protein
MAAASKFQVMTMTDAAAERVRELVDNADGEARVLRVGIKKGGCAGMEYTMDLVEEAKPGDDLIEDKGAKLFVDPSAFCSCWERRWILKSPSSAPGSSSRTQRSVRLRLRRIRVASGSRPDPRPWPGRSIS